MIPGIFEIPKKKSTTEERRVLSSRLYHAARDIVEKLATLDEAFEQDAVLEITKSLLTVDRSKNHVLGMADLQKQFGGILGTNGVPYQMPVECQNLNPWVKKMLDEEGEDEPLD